ncbi:MAG: HEAT repeat domain-containing protein [Chloroflexi bacterium]|nr:HEAT repeat domain-containing protein [Chloroflexota bacterium]
MMKKMQRAWILILFIFLISNVPVFGYFYDYHSFEDCLKLLKSGDVYDRINAAKALGSTGYADAVPALVNALYDRNWKVANAAADVLGSMGKPAVKPLIEILKNGNRLQRGLAAGALGMTHDERAVPALLNALDDKDPVVRTRATRALGEIGDTRAIAPLIKNLDSRYPYLSSASAEALGDIGDEQASSALIKIIDGDLENNELIIASIRALGEIGDEKAIPHIINLMKRISNSRKPSLIHTYRDNFNYSFPEALALFGPRVGKYLTPLLDVENDILREVALGLIDKFNFELPVDTLISLLKSDNKSIRLMSVRMLGNIGDLKAVPALIESLDSKTAYIAVEALGKIGDKRAVPALLEALKNGGRNESGITQALKKIDDRRAIPVFLDILEDSNYKCHEGVSSVLLEMRVPEVLPYLVDSLKDGSYTDYDAIILFNDKSIIPQLRSLMMGDTAPQTAAIILGEMGDSCSVPKLMYILENEKDQDIRYKAMQALGKIDSDDATRALIYTLGDNDLGNQAVDILSTRGIKITDDLKKAFVVSKTGTTRFNIAKTLIKINGRKDVKYLMELIQDKDPDVRKQVIQYISDVRYEEAVPSLINSLRDNDPDVRRDAAARLGSLGDKKTVPYLIQSLNDPEAQVREAAAEALGYIGVVSAVEPLLRAKNISSNTISNSLSRIGSDALPQMLNAMKNGNSTTKIMIINALRSIHNEEVVRVLQEALHDSDKDVSMTAKQVLSNMKESYALPAVIALLKDSDSSIKLAAINTLGNSKDKRAVAALFSWLNDKDPTIRKEAAETLLRKGTTEKLPELIKVIDNNNNVQDKFNLASYLLRYNEPEIRKKGIEILIKIAEDKDIYYRERAISDLAELHAKEALPYLLHLLNKTISVNYTNERLREAIVRALFGMPDMMSLPALIKDSNLSPSGTSEAVAKLGKPALPALKDALGKDNNWRTKAWAAETIGMIDDDSSFKILLGTLKDDDWRVRAGAVKGLGRLKNEAAVQYLIPMLDDEYDIVIKEAVYALGETGSPEAFAAVIKKIKDKAWDYNVTASAAYTISKTKDKQTAPDLISIIKDESYYTLVKKNAIEGLGNTGYKAASPLLIELLNDKNSDIRSAAACALGKVGGADAVDPLIKIITDRDILVMPCTVTALGEIGDKKALPALIEVYNDSIFISRVNDNLKAKTIKAMGKIGSPEVLPYIIESLKKDYSSESESAIEALGDMGDEPSKILLTQVMNDMSYNTSLRLDAAEQLGRLKDKRALTFLIGFLNNENSYETCEAAKALGEMGDPSALAPLEKLLDAQDSDVRKCAKKAIEQIKNSMKNR